jgi:hypothetical protein
MHPVRQPRRDNWQSKTRPRATGARFKRFHAGILAWSVLIITCDNYNRAAAGIAPFQEGRGFSTIMFWIAFFMCPFMVSALSSWLAKLTTGAGYSLGAALSFVLVLNFGAVIGAVGGMALPLRQNFQAMAVPARVAAVSVALISHGRSASTASRAGVVPAHSEA